MLGSIYIKRWINKLLNILWKLCIFTCIFQILQITSFTSFRIPTDSMQPTLQPGDNILVNKCIMGARIFDVWEAVEDKEVDIYRLPGIGKVKRGDVLCWCFTIPIRIVTTAFQCTC